MCRTACTQARLQHVGVNMIHVQDGQRQQQYIDHLEDEVVRLQQLLQVRPAGCHATMLHQNAASRHPCMRLA